VCAGHVVAWDGKLKVLTPARGHTSKYIIGVVGEAIEFASGRDMQAMSVQVRCGRIAELSSSDIAANVVGRAQAVHKCYPESLPRIHSECRTRHPTIETSCVEARC